MGEILIETKYVTKIASITFEPSGHEPNLFSTTMNQADVCECLNRRQSDGHHLQFLLNSSELPKRYLRIKVEAFRAEMIGSYEIARNTGVDVRKIERILRDHGVNPVVWKFYKRSDVERLMLSGNQPEVIRRLAPLSA